MPDVQDDLPVLVFLGLQLPSARKRRHSSEEVPEDDAGGSSGGESDDDEDEDCSDKILVMANLAEGTIIPNPIRAR